MWNGTDTLKGRSQFKYYLSTEVNDGEYYPVRTS